jgi:hypothetical protein
MRSREEIEDKIAQIQEWQSTVNRQQKLFQSAIDAENIDKARSYQKITIDGLCNDADVTALSNMLDGAIHILCWALGEEY